MTRHPELQSKWERSFRARRYYVYTIGNITEDAIKNISKNSQTSQGKKKTKVTLDYKNILMLIENLKLKLRLNDEYDIQ